MTSLGLVARTAAVAAIPGLALVACGHADEDAGQWPEVTVGSARIRAADASPALGAADSIAEARCARESLCGSVGPGLRYPTAEDCRVRVRIEWRDELEASRCPGGVDEDQLRDCIRALRRAGCTVLFDSIRGNMACQPQFLCREGE